MTRAHLILLSLAATMSLPSLARTGFALAFSRTQRMPRATTARLMSATVSPAPVLRRVKAAEATEPSEGPVTVKGWVRTVRKQKTLAFVEVNDGSNLAGIQCVAAFDAIDDETKNGTLI